SACGMCKSLAISSRVSPSTVTWWTIRKVPCLVNPPIVSSDAIHPTPTCSRRQGAAKPATDHHSSGCCKHGKCFDPLVAHPNGEVDHDMLSGGRVNIERQCSAFDSATSGGAVGKHKLVEGSLKGALRREPDGDCVSRQYPGLARQAMPSRP